jgi:hypothetical protein
LRKICSLFVIVTAVIISPVVTTNFYAYAVQSIWRDYENMKELVKDIRNGNKDDDNLDWDKFRESSVYKNENEDIRDCIDLANKVGGKLGDYEIVRCFDNANYYKEKYTDEKGNKNEQDASKQQEVNQSQSQQEQEVNQNQSEIELDVSQTQNSSDVNSPQGCDSSYPDICISITSAKMSCFDIPYKNFKVLLPDRHKFDSDGDGIGCEG